MARYINVGEIGIGKCNPDVFKDKEYARGWNDAVELIEKTPTADVVEVVRCKDCEYSEESDVVFGVIDYKCSKLNTTCLSAEDFCSYGKKVE